MTYILAIDPASNNAKTSNTGIVLMDNATCIYHQSAAYGVTGFLNWYNREGKALIAKYKPLVVVEKFEERFSKHARDNSVVETIDTILGKIPQANLMRNVGYTTDIPDKLMKALGLWKFPSTHHNDIRAAARLALFYAMRNDIEDVVTDIGLKLHQP